MFERIRDRFTRGRTGPITVDELLAEARAGLCRLTAPQARDAVAGGAVLVDIRPVDLRDRDGVVPGAVIIGTNVIEWRADPASQHRDERIASRGKHVIVFCDEGYKSSLVAATLRRLGLDATDLIGGVQAWIKAGLPIEGGRRADK